MHWSFNWYGIDGHIQTVTYRVDGDAGYVADVQYSGEAKFAPAPAHPAPVHPVVHAAPVHPVVHAAPIHPVVRPVHPVVHPAPVFHPAPIFHA